MQIDGDLAEIIGIHIGDGCISKNERYFEYYIGGDLKEEREYHDKWVSHLFNKKVMLPLLNKRVVYKEYPKTGVYGLYIFDKEVFSFFEKLGLPCGTKINVEVPSQILNNKSLSIRFLRGLFDTDGSIYFDKNKSSNHPINNRPIIKLGTVSKILSKQVFVMLKDLGLNPRMKKPYKGKRDKNEVYTILIYRILDIKYFIKYIGFKNPKHYTKWMIFKNQGYCPPYTNLQERKCILERLTKRKVL